MRKNILENILNLEKKESANLTLRRHKGHKDNIKVVVLKQPLSFLLLSRSYYCGIHSILSCVHTWYSSEAKLANISLLPSFSLFLIPPILGHIFYMKKCLIQHDEARESRMNKREPRLSLYLLSVSSSFSCIEQQVWTRFFSLFFLYMPSLLSFASFSLFLSPERWWAMKKKKKKEPWKRTLTPKMLFLFLPFVCIIHVKRLLFSPSSVL